MRRVASALVLLCSLLAPPARCGVVVRGAGTAPVAASPPAAGRVLVVDDAGAFDTGPHGEPGSRHAALSRLLARDGFSRCTPLWRAPGPTAARFLVLECPRAGFDPAEAARELRASGLVRAAVPDVKIRLHVLPNDPDLPSQWYVNDSGGAGVGLPAAWDVEKGSPSVRIGIMDTGVDPGHPDLASKIWTNPGEVAGNGIDDDGNGYIDDVHGWDFGDGDNDAEPEAAPDSAASGVDVGFHGTFVAGIAAAATDNAEGIAGAAWNCSIVPLKVADAAGDITLAAMTEAFGYATAMHLEVLNVSLGAAGDPGVPEYFQALVDAATAGGVLVVASAGNDGTDAPNYPAACTGVLSVAATDEANDRASFSNYGPAVRIAAPGAGMWSALCRNYDIDEFSQLFYEVFFGWDGVSPYMAGDGTSFSAPLVAGASALVRSRHPAWPPLVVGAHMVATGDVVGYDEPIGPRLNVLRAVSDPTLSAPATTFAHAELSVAPNPTSEAAIIRFGLPTDGPARLRVYDCAGRLMHEFPSTEMSAGAHTVSWDGTDAHGGAANPGVYVVRLETANGAIVRKLARVK